MRRDPKDEREDAVVAPGWCVDCDERKMVMADTNSMLALAMGGESALGSVVGICSDCLGTKVADAIKEAVESLGLEDTEAADLLPKLFDQDEDAA